MSLTSGLHSPRTPLRRFLDQELSAGPRPLRENFRAQNSGHQHVLLPGPGVGTEAGTVGTAIDQRLRLAFTAAAPVDQATQIGMQASSRIGRLADVGDQLARRLSETVHSLDLDNRQMPLERAHDEEEDLARMLLAAAWFAVACRNFFGFLYTPLYLAATDDPGGFTLERLLELPRPDMVADVVAQVYRAADSDLEKLRRNTEPAQCTGGPTFAGVDIQADADLVVDGLLLDFKSTRHTLQMEQRTAWQLLGYLLLDTEDRYRIESLGLYMSRSGTLANWPVDDYLTLLGTRRRDLSELRALFAELLAGCLADCEPLTPEDEGRTRHLLQRLSPVITSGHCLVCAQALPSGGHCQRIYCSRWCGQRASTLRRRGWLLEPTA